ncbi:unnamed protein product [Arctia plantaginis]|uniref:LITAF domain-containing protein n=1 Tax=Arctia plantaginis TaxID=874455 RepID=A0A8S1BCP4_ARCPL|nr:unnamed protein product [Arctia plantaginis]
MESKNEKQFTADPPPYSDSPVLPDQTTAEKSGAEKFDGATTAVHSNAPIVVPVLVENKMGPKPAVIVCPSCREQIVTRVERKVTTKTHIFAGLLCFLGGLCCVWIPYFVGSCQNADHYCPNCNTFIGSYEH